MANRYSKQDCLYRRIQRDQSFVTDSINPYPTNNISSFQFSIINCTYYNIGNNCESNYWGPFFNITHRIDTDAGIDGGTIEVSYDNGSNWKNLIEDTINFPYLNYTDFYTVNDTITSLGKPGFSGSTDWEYFSFSGFPVETENTYDTITFRFTFASDSIQTNRDGWMIGRIYLGGEFEGVEEIQTDNLISISPNPTSNELRIQKTKFSEKSSVQVLNCSGQILYNNPNFIGETIDTQQLSNGLYYLKYSDQKHFTIEKFVVQH